MQAQNQQVNRNLAKGHGEADGSESFGQNSRVLESSYFECLGINDSFPFKLHLMLTEMEERGCSHVVSWQPHGRCFIVHNRNLFLKKVLPAFFRMSKYASFQRQLNIYGFNRITAGLDKGGYFHESFVRGRLDLSFEIQRQKVKGTYVRKPAAPDQEPNLYNFPHAPPSIPTKSKAWETEALPSNECQWVDPARHVASRLVDPSPNMAASSLCQSLGTLMSSSPAVLANSLMQNVSLRASAGVANDAFAHDYNHQTTSTYAMTRNLSFSLNPFEDSLDGNVSPIDPTNQRRYRTQLQQQLQPIMRNEMDRSFDALLTALREMDDVTSNPLFSEPTMGPTF